MCLIAIESLSSQDCFWTFFLSPISIWSRGISRKAIDAAIPTHLQQKRPNLCGHVVGGSRMKDDEG